jgi:gamma-butyrobetaine dioxygenase
MAGDAGLRPFVRSVWTHGVTFVRNTPSTQDALLELARRVGHLRETNFGLDWQVENKPNPNNVAYTAIELQLHVDLPNREAPPGIQFLHCLVAEAPGGDSTLADGFWIAEELRRTDPEAFRLLSTVPIGYRFHDREHDLRWRAPVISLADDGSLREVRFHTALREPLDVPLELVAPMHRAMHAFETLCRRDDVRVCVHLEAGDTMVFHNRRVLHGRTAFDPNGGRRSLHGAYVDVDEWLSRIRMLG